LLPLLLPVLPHLLLPVLLLVVLPVLLLVVLPALLPVLLLVVRCVMQVPELSSATAWAIACPACMTLGLAASCAPFVTTLVHGTDIVPTFSSGALDRLRDEVRLARDRLWCSV
jgi:hypothetical protein